MLLSHHSQLAIILSVVLFGPTQAARAAGRHRAEEDAEEGEEDAAAHEAGPDQLQLQGLEALVPDADEGDDESDADLQQDDDPEAPDDDIDTDHAEAHVQDHVGRAAPLELLPIRPGGQWSSFSFFTRGNLKKQILFKTESNQIYYIMLRYYKDKTPCYLKFRAHQSQSLQFICHFTHYHY